MDSIFESAGQISDMRVKQSCEKALCDLGKDDRFIWELPEYEKDVNGDFTNKDDPVVTKNASNPFAG